MGKRGPQRTPLAILKKKGSNRASGRASDKNRTIKETPGAPPMPEGLSEEEKVIFKELVDSLSRMEVLTVEDGRALKMLCQLEARRDALHRQVSEDGGFYVMNAEQRCETPESKKLTVIDKQLVTLWGRYGLTASDRASLGAPVKAEPVTPGKKGKYWPEVG